jgi:hypothetical protein
MQTYTEKPRYRTTLPGGTVLRSQIFAAGLEVEFIGWPKPSLALVPVNESATAVAKYLQARAGGFGLPETPWDSDSNAIVLPAYAVPIWKVLRRGYFTKVVTNPDRPFASADELIPAGQRLYSVGWPNWTPDEAVPDNDEARSVLEFFNLHRDEPRPPVAWNVPMGSIMTLEQWEKINRPGASWKSYARSSTERLGSHRKPPVDTRRQYDPFAAA